MRRSTGGRPHNNQPRSEIIGARITKGEEMRKENYVIITDDEGNKKAFYNFHELIKYLDSFKMSFLPDGFSYTIHEE
jgi:hypothetical protein|tara:strand:+ start:270 stop:500 length:231 start_codon:yes stop_codon:yes gene_type:complete